MSVDLRAKWIVLVMALLVVLVATGAQDANFHNAPASAKEMKNPYADKVSPEGKTSYESRCAACHGSNGKGTWNIPSLATGPAQSASDGEIFWYITKGDLNIKATSLPLSTYRGIDRPVWATS